MAWCFVKAEELEKAIADGKLYSFRTLDLSPKAGYEWLMHGASTLRERLGPNSILWIRSKSYLDFMLILSLCAPRFPPRPDQRHREKVPSRKKLHQSHTKVILMSYLHQSLSKVIPMSRQCHPIVASKSAHSHPNVTAKSPCSHTKVAPKSSQCHTKVTP